MRVITYYHITILLCAFLTAYTFLPATSSANPVQKHICLAGGNLGFAEARLIIFGNEYGDAIPDQQKGFIANNLRIASEQITAAEARYGEPIKTYQKRNKSVANVQTKLANYASKTSGRSYQNKANYIKNIVDSYRSSLAITYVRSRPDDYRYNPNCDSKIFMACYHYARAQLASGGDSASANSYKGVATQYFRNTVHAGLAVAMDVGHSPWDGHAQKICCTFGAPADWTVMELGRFQLVTPASFYVEKMPVMLGIINDAAALDPVCKSDDYDYGPSSPYDEKEEGVRFAGRWRCPDGTLVVNQNGSRVSGYWEGAESYPYNGVVTGKTMELHMRYGETRDDLTANISSDGSRLDIQNFTRYGGESNSILYSCTK